MRNKIFFLKRTAWTFCTVAFSIAIHGQNTAQITEVPFTQVRIQDAFWSPRIETNRTVSIPSAFRECEKNGRFDNFAIAGGLKEGEHRGDFSFDDTDPYKIIEGASYSLAVKYDARLGCLSGQRHRTDCRRAGIRRLPDHLRDQPLYPSFGLVGNTPLGENQQPRTLQFRTSLRSCRGTLSRHGQTFPIGRGYQKRRFGMPCIRP